MNGLRAIAVMGVLISHITRSLDSFGLDPFLFGKAADNTPKGLILAGFGVSIFFALSGFLITYLLLLEKEKQPVNVPHFYIRRILRIWPLYYLYIGLVIITMLAYNSNTNLFGPSLPFYIFFAANVPYILQTSIPWLAHYWSLGVEEQFYIFWPWIMKKTSKKLQTIITLSIVCLICVKLYARYFLPGGDTSTIYQALHVTRFQCMLIGALGATLFYNKQHLFFEIVTHKITQALAWLVILLVVVNVFHISSVLDQEFISIVTVVLIIGQCTIKNRLINLEVPAMDFLGKISYGIYVLHPLVIFFGAKFYSLFSLNPGMKYVFIYLSIIATTIGIAYLSYRFFEKRFLRLKLSYSVIPSSDTK